MKTVGSAPALAEGDQPMKRLRYMWLRRRGYQIDGIVSVRHIDDLFSTPPCVYKRSSKLVMRKGLSVRALHFPRLTAEQLEAGLLAEAGQVTAH